MNTLRAFCEQSGDCGNNAANSYIIHSMDTADELVEKNYVGLLVSVHGEKTKANMASNSATTFAVSPGTETTIQVSTTIRERLPPPYTNCTFQRWLDDGETIDYAIDTCINLCFQQQV